MFARQPNRFIDYSNQKLNLDCNKVINELLEMNKTKNEVVIPSIVERSTSIKEKNRLDLDKRRKQIPELLPGQKVMLFDDARTDKLDPIYEGPFEIVARQAKNNYILKDATGQNLPKPFPVEKFKIIDASVPLSVPLIDSANQDTNISDEQKSWYVKSILDHKKNQDGSFSYKVRWQGWDEKEKIRYFREGRLIRN